MVDEVDSKRQLVDRAFKEITRMDGSALAARSLVRGASTVGVSSPETYSEMVLALLRVAITSCTAVSIKPSQVLKDATDSASSLLWDKDSTLAENYRNSPTASTDATIMHGAGRTAQTFIRVDEIFEKLDREGFNQTANEASNACARALAMIFETEFVSLPSSTAKNEILIALYEETLFEASNLDGSVGSRSELFELSLWKTKFLSKERQESLIDLSFALLDRLDADPDFRFWAAWYRSMIDGKPLDWALQSEVALIGDDVWEAGKGAVARAIGKIEAKHAARNAIENLEAEFVSQTDIRHQIGANKGPALDEPNPKETTTIIWAPIEALKDELQAKTPDSSRVAATLGTLKLTFKEVCFWAGRKADLSVDTAIKWGIPLAGAAILASSAEAPTLLQNVIASVERWLALL